MTSLVVLCCLALTPDGMQPPTSAPPTAPAPVDVVAALETAMTDAIARAEPSVVAIHRDKAENTQETQAVRGRKPAPVFPEPSQLDFRLRPPGDRDDLISFDYGSGVVIGLRGEILTAFHVVRGARRLRVRAVSTPPFDAEVIAADPRTDMAVIAPRAVPGVDAPRLKPLAIGDSTRLRKGSFVIALGNPFNAAQDGSPSASWGIVSNLARKLISTEDTKPPPLRYYPTLLQLDAKLNLGMSGGAVINLKGELVGLTTTAASPAGFDSQAGYAIPMDRLGRRVVETLLQGKEVEYGLLGIHSSDYSNRVNETSPHSPAAIHLQIGDEILAVNGVPVHDFASLILAVNAYPAGAEIRLKIRRSNELIERTLVLAKFPVDGEIIATNRPNPWRGLRVDYMTLQNYGAIGRPFEDVPSAGVVITEVEEGSPAESAGLKKGQLIRRVGQRPVLNPKAFAEAVAKQDGPVTFDTDHGVVTVGP
jgi:serine protease Do